MALSTGHLVPMSKCVLDPYYHVSKDRTFIAYPDTQDTADRLRAIRAGVAPLLRLKTTWPLTTYSEHPAALAAIECGGSCPSPLACAAAGKVSGLGAGDAWPLRAQHAQYQPEHAQYQPEPQLAFDDPRRSALFWGGGQYSAASRLVRAAATGLQFAVAARPDRAHSSAWHRSPGYCDAHSSYSGYDSARVEGCSTGGGHDSVAQVAALREAERRKQILPLPTRERRFNRAFAEHARPIFVEPSKRCMR